MVNIDVPTAFAAVLISISLSFVRDNITDIVQSRIRSTTEKYEEGINWLNETEAIAEQIEGLVISLQAESNALKFTKSGVVDQMEKVTLEDVDSLSEYESELTDIDGVGELDIQVETQDHFVFEEEFDEIKSQTIEGMREEGFDIESDLSHRITAEMYEKFKDLNEHYSHRPLTLNDDLWEAYTGLRSRCYGLKYLEKVEESEVDEIQDLVGELIDETEEEKDRLYKEKRLKNRFLRAFRSKFPF